MSLLRVRSHFFGQENLFYLEPISCSSLCSEDEEKLLVHGKPALRV